MKNIIKYDNIKTKASIDWNGVLSIQTWLLHLLSVCSNSCLLLNVTWKEVMRLTKIRITEINEWVFHPDIPKQKFCLNWILEILPHSENKRPISLSRASLLFGIEEMLDWLEFVEYMDQFNTLIRWKRTTFSGFEIDDMLFCLWPYQKKRFFRLVQQVL